MLTSPHNLGDCHQERTPNDVRVPKHATTTAPSWLLRHATYLAKAILVRRQTPNTTDEPAPPNPAPRDHPASIFSSPSPADQQLAQTLNDRLKTHSYHLWIDQHELRAGDPLIERHRRFERINARLRQVAVTAGMYVTLLGWCVAVAAYIVALATGHGSPPPPPPLPWLMP
jgi:hypothetical protein